MKKLVMISMLGLVGACAPEEGPVNFDMPKVATDVCYDFSEDMQLLHTRIDDLKKANKKLTAELKEADLRARSSRGSHRHRTVVVTCPAPEECPVCEDNGDLLAQLQNSLNQCNVDKANTEAELAACADDRDDCNEDLAECNAEKTACNESDNECRENLENCHDDLNQCQNDDDNDDEDDGNNGGGNDEDGDDESNPGNN